MCADGAALPSRRWHATQGSVDICGRYGVCTVATCLSPPKRRAGSLTLVTLTGGGSSSGQLRSGPNGREISVVDAKIAILAVDDDPGTRELFRLELVPAGFAVRTASKGGEAIDLTASQAFDLAYIDLRLPDMDGMEVIASIRHRIASQKIVLISAFLTIEVAVEAMRLGAIDVLEKPLDGSELPAMVFAGLRGQRFHRHGRPFEGSPGPTVNESPGEMLQSSVAVRWARHVLRGLNADGDVRTIADWARLVGVSRSSLKAECELLGIPARSARDLIRALRALSVAARYGCPPEAVLGSSDMRSVRDLFHRGGIPLATNLRFDLRQYIEQQKYVDAHHIGMRVLLKLLREKIH